MNKSVLGVVGCAAALFAVAGCTPEARQDVGQAGENVGQATSKSVEGTKEAAGKAADATADAAKAAGKEVANATDKAVDATKDAAADAANATAKAAAKTGEAVGDAAHATEKTVAKAGESVSNAADTAGLSLKVKNAILVDDSINSKNINVDTMADTKMVSITGSVPDAGQKTKVSTLAKKALADAKSDYKLDNKLTVGAAKM